MYKLAEIQSLASSLNQTNDVLFGVCFVQKSGLFEDELNVFIYCFCV